MTEFQGWLIIMWLALISIQLGQINLKGKK